MVSKEEWIEARRQLKAAKAAEPAGKALNGEDAQLKPKLTRAHEALLDAIKERLGIELSFDEFSRKIIISGFDDSYFDGELSDNSIIHLRHLLLEACVKQTPSSSMLMEFCVGEACKHRFHPVKDWLAGLVWDGVERIVEWLSTYLGAANNELNREIGKLWLIGAVRRIRSPGCKFDFILMLQGETGLGKSRACKALCPRQEWFSDCFPPFHDERRQIEEMAGKWIIEYPDLAGMRKAEEEKIKAFLSRQVDRARPAYGRILVEARRQCVFVGTTEQTHPLTALTNRRIWPVDCETIDIEGLEMDRDQLWAEASYLEGKGTEIGLSENLWKEAAEVQIEHTQPPQYVEDLAAILGDQEGVVGVSDIRKRLDISLQAWPSCCRPVAKSMEFLGFVRVRLGRDSHGYRRREYVWAKGQWVHSIVELERISLL